MALGAEKNETKTPPNTLSDRTEYDKMPGKALVQKLLDAGTCSMAFYELWRRGNREKDAGYESFLGNHYDPKVVICSQEAEKPKIYVVLYGYLGRDTFSIEDDYEIPNPSELFLPSNSWGNVGTWKEPALDVFTSEGKCIEPFGGDNVLNTPGVIADINGDGLVERADHVAYGVDGIRNADVLHICVVRPEPQPILNVLFNWGEDEWAYQFTDSDKDGILDVELGPKVAGGIKTKVVYKWDKDKKAYAGPAGKDGDHFRLLDTAKTWPEFEQMKKVKLTFPKDPDFVDEHNTGNGPWARLGQKKPSSNELSKPYHYASLKGLSNEDIVRYMGAGKNQSELQWANVIKTHIPSNFWTLDPKSAALATADENRYPDHRKRFRLAIDDRDGQKPHDVCSLAFTDSSDRSYYAVDSHYFLRVDPKKSYLAYAQSWAGGMVGYNFVRDQPVFDFRFCELPYEETRHLAHTIWWLNRVRSLSDASIHGRTFSGSSADGRGSLTIRSDSGDVIIKLSETLWAGHVSERWRADYNKTVCLNLASFLIDSALTAHLGDRWSRFKPPHHPTRFLAGLACETNSPQNEQDHRKNIQALTVTFLDLFSQDQKYISFAIVRQSARVAGSLVCTNLSTKLADIQSRLPTDSAPKRTKGEIEAKIKRLDGIKPNDKRWQDAMAQKSALYKELSVLYHDTGDDAPGALRGSISVALKKIRCADDLQALQDWACLKEPGSQWALQRLKDKDHKRYVAALEWWLKNTKEKWVRQAYDAIAKEDSQRAVEIAKEIPPDKKGALTVSAFSHLAEVDGIPDEQKRVKALIQIALDPKSGWEERGKAIELLVPPDQPLRYPAPDIDAALVKLLSPKLADDVINFTLGHACRALARQGKTEYFDKMAETLDRTEDGTIYNSVLGAVTQLAQCDPAKYNPRLLAILQPQLKRTNYMMTDLLMAVWSADLRELKPDLESIATSGPDDYEDERAHSWGSEVRVVDGRFHLARKIVSLWNEEDLATRCRLLLIFGLNENCLYSGNPDRLARIKNELTKTVQVLTPEQRKQMIVFIEWYQGVKIYKEESVGAKFIAMAKKILNMQ